MNNTVLSVYDLNKKYPTFQLNHINFKIDKGEIMVLVGRNGAGKSTLFKSLLHLVHPDTGTINFFGLSFDTSEQEIKHQLGYAAGGVNYYERKTISKIASTTKMFYPNWDDALYKQYLKTFAIDDQKKTYELSDGMRVKLNLALALSHQAQFLILDEPTSGLDLVSRNEILDILKDLAKKGITILFSTQISTDIEKCADQIIYLKKGNMLYTGDVAGFLQTIEAPTIDKAILKIETEDKPDEASA